MRRFVLPPLFFSVRIPTLLAMFWRNYFRRDYDAGLSTNERLSMIVFRLDSLGDVVLTTPLFRELRKAYPKSRITVVVQEAYRALLVTNPHIDEILSLPDIKPVWRLPQGAKRLLSALLLYRTRLRGRHFDFAVSPRWDVDEHLATFLCVLTDATRRVGYSVTASPAKQSINRGFDAVFTDCIQPGETRHEVLRNLAVVEALGGAPSNDALEIHLTERDRRRAAKLLVPAASPSKLIAIGIGAHSPGRRWPVESYSRALLQLATECPVQIVVVCSAVERGEALKLVRSVIGDAIIVSGAPIREVCAVLERCDLFIGNDSGCAHLAAAVGCKTIVISRHPSDGDPNHYNSPVRFRPRGSYVCVLQPASGLENCRSACSQPEPHCITSIAVKEVVTAASKMLRSPRDEIAPPTTGLWPDTASYLVRSHSAEAVQRAVETLRYGHSQPPTSS
jgi:ADP-heptose:LPS heptosyltransferase